MLGLGVGIWDLGLGFGLGLGLGVRVRVGVRKRGGFGCLTNNETRGVVWSKQGKTRERGVGKPRTSRPSLQSVTY